MSLITSKTMTVQVDTVRFNKDEEKTILSFLPTGTYIQDYKRLKCILPNGNILVKVNYFDINPILNKPILIPTKSMEKYDDRTYIYVDGPLYVKLMGIRSNDFQRENILMKLSLITKKDSIFNVFAMKVNKPFSRIIVPGLNSYEVPHFHKSDKNNTVQIPNSVRNFIQNQIENDLPVYEGLLNHEEDRIMYDMNKFYLSFKTLNKIVYVPSGEDFKFMSCYNVGYLMDYREYLKIKDNKNVALYFHENRSCIYSVLVYPVLGYVINDKDLEIVDKILDYEISVTNEVD